MDAGHTGAELTVQEQPPSLAAEAPPVPPAPPMPPVPELPHGCDARQVVNIARSASTALMFPVPATSSFRNEPAVSPVRSTSMLAASDGILFVVVEFFGATK